MNPSIRLPRRPQGLLLAPLALALSLPLSAQGGAQEPLEELTPYAEDSIEAAEAREARENRRKGKKRKFSPWFQELRRSRDQYLPAPPKSAAWNDPEAVRRGSDMKGRLLAAAGGWEAFAAMGGVRYDMLQTVKVDTQQEPQPWRVHHYEPRLCHFNTDGNGYLYTEWARPSLTGPDFVREIIYSGHQWREMRGSFLRTFGARKTTFATVRFEQLTGLMPFSLEMLGAELAYVKGEQSPVGQVEVYAMTLADPLLILHFPMVVEEYGLIDELLLYVDPQQDKVVQLRYCFGDPAIKKPPHLRWWTVDFEDEVEVEGVIRLPKMRYRWLDGWQNIDEMEAADFVAEKIPPAALRRPWQSGGVYDMPYRCDAWDPPDGTVTGLSGHGTGITHPRPGTYPADHPKSRPTKFPSLGTEEDSGSGDAADEPPR